MRRGEAVHLLRPFPFALLIVAGLHSTCLNRIRMGAAPGCGNRMLDFTKHAKRTFVRRHGDIDLDRQSEWGVPGGQRSDQKKPGDAGLS